MLHNRQRPQHPRPGTGAVSRWLRRMSVALLALALLPVAQAEDGYELWLLPPAGGRAAAALPAAPGAAGGAGVTPTQRVARELLRGFMGGLLGRAPAVADAPSAASAVLVSTPASLPALAGLRLDLEARRRGLPDPQRRAGRAPGHGGGRQQRYRRALRQLPPARLLPTRQPLDALDLRQAPKATARPTTGTTRPLRRARLPGQSIWNWHLLPDWLDPRYTDYARANASSASTAPCSTTSTPTRRSSRRCTWTRSRLAGVLRPYGIRVYLSALQRAPMEIGGWTRPIRWIQRCSAGGRTRPRRSTRASPTSGLPGQSQFGRPARPAGLRPHPRRQREHAAEVLPARRR